METPKAEVKKETLKEVTTVEVIDKGSHFVTIHKVADEKNKDLHNKFSFPTLEFKSPEAMEKFYSDLARSKGSTLTGKDVIFGLAKQALKVKLQGKAKAAINLLDKAGQRKYLAEHGGELMSVADAEGYLPGSIEPSTEAGLNRARQKAFEAAEQARKDGNESASVIHLAKAKEWNTKYLALVTANANTKLAGVKK